MSRILDATCGGWLIYGGEHPGPPVVGIDIRNGKFSYGGWHKGKSSHKRSNVVHPDIQADLTQPPFRSAMFDATIFDPPSPHSGGGAFTVLYSSISKRDYQTLLIKAMNSFAKLMKPGGMMLVKCSDATFPASRMIKQFFMSKFKFLLEIKQAPVLVFGRESKETKWLVFARVHSS